MATEKEATKITFGGWYQRTTLHLSEIYNFLSKGKSDLELNGAKLKNLHEKLDLKSVNMETSYLDYIKAITKQGIEIRYYEDGLYVLEIASEDIERSVKLIDNYFEKCFKPAVDYIFSLGAPTPKILSNMKDIHTIVISKYFREHSRFDVPGKFGNVYSKTTSRDISVYKTPQYIFIVGMPNKKESMRVIVEMQIFFREFKEQLHKYLNIHRKIWEEISDIKERKFVKGKEVEFYRAKLETYKKTIDLINNRINQMPSHTRASIAKYLNVEKHLIELFRYKFEDLFNSLEYIKELWKMTEKYVNSSIQVLVEISNKTAVSGIRSIQVLASIGVFTGIVGYLTRDSLPKVSQVGVIYLLFLAAAVLIIDTTIKLYSKNKKYEMKFNDSEKGL